MIPTDKNILVIVESPTKVATVSKIFKELGYLNTTVLASIGHTTKLKDKQGSYKNTGIFPEDSFRAEWGVDPDKKAIVETIKKQARKADLVLIASDPDREGESLGNHIKNLIGLAENQYYRIKYNSLTKSEIENALKHPEKMNKHLCAASESRQMVDKMIGYALSPISKAYVGARSVGRCQSAGLKLIVDLEHEIQNFEPEFYYDIYLQFTKNGKRYKAKYIGTASEKVDKITDKSLADQVIFDCYKPFKVKEVTAHTKKEYPKPPFCTASFQQEAASKLKLRVKDAMASAQKLFEGIVIDGEHTGLCTYMRTDSTTFSKDFTEELQHYITEIFGKSSFNKPVITKQKLAQEGHEALRVVNPFLTPELLKKHITNDKQLKVYKLIWQRTIAAVLPPAEVLESSILIENNGHLFSCTTDNLIMPGFKQVYGNVAEEPSEVFCAGETLTDTEIASNFKHTSPPTRYTEAALVNELQKRGIGRPSTYATIIETILSPTRGYCVMEENKIVPTDRGMQLSGFLDRAFSSVISLDYTKQLEESLDKIASNSLNHIDFLTEFYSTLETAISKNAETAASTIQLDTKNCPICGQTMVVRRSRYGKLFYGCSQYPACRGIVGLD